MRPNSYIVQEQQSYLKQRCFASEYLSAKKFDLNLTSFARAGQL